MNYYRHHLSELSLVLSLLTLPLLSYAGDRTQCTSLLHAFSIAHLRTWRPSTDCCQWDGVACDPLTGRIISLDISNRSVYGTVGPSLFNLTSLETLNLAYNRFDGSQIPPEVGNLANLTHLNLSNSGFIGQIPSSIAGLTNLISLDLSELYFWHFHKLDNPRFGTLIRNLSNLEELYLDGVNISANGKEWGGALANSTPRLRILSLSDCSISGPIDESLSKLANLSVIRLDYNELNSTVPDFFASFASLSILTLSYAGLRGVFPNGVFGLKNLMSVDLSANPMLSGELAEFPNDSLIEKLDIWETNFSGQLPDSIGKLSYLTSLDLWSCLFSGPLPPSIGNLTRLVFLDLSWNRFSGAIPSVMPLMISKLHLEGNSLNGSIPLSFGELLSLTELDLSQNSLSGPIPASLFALPSMQELVLNQNQLSGRVEEFPNASLQLTIVDLSYNNLSGEIPKSVFRISGLESLSLSWNNFSGVVDLDWLIDFRNLSSLDLSYNSLWIQGGAVNASLSFPAISELYLASCNLTQVPSFLKSQDQIEVLDLSNNRIGGSIPNWIWGSMNLGYLNLSANLFTSVEGPLPTNFSTSFGNIIDLHSNFLQGPIPLLRSNSIMLDYSNNNFSSSIPSNIGMYLNYTNFFSLANNSVTGVIPASICNVNSLEVLDLSDNMLIGSIPSCLPQADGYLQVLNLRNNQLQSVIPQNIGEGYHLQSIDLNSNSLEGEVPSSLANCTNLELLDLGNNHIVGSFPFWLASISSLRVLILRSNELKGPVVVPKENLANFPSLQILDLSSNHFNGTLPKDVFKNLKVMMISSAHNSSSTVEYKYVEFDLAYYYYFTNQYYDTVTITIKGLDLELMKILTVFTSIDISNNHFIGDIPEEIGNLSSLLMLNLSHNALTGLILRSIGNMRQLESLDLSQNSLSGDISQGLASLNFLSSLNLSNNNLVGKIPEGSQLSTFSNASFQDNEGVCGTPLSKHCDDPRISSTSDSTDSSDDDSAYIIEMALSIGLGYGVGIALVVVSQAISCKKKKVTNTRR